MISAAGPRLRTLLRGVETPLGPNPGCCFILSPILLHALYFRLEPRIEHRHPKLLKKFADAVAPAKLLFSLPRRDEIHWARKIYPGVAQQIRRSHFCH